MRVAGCFSHELCMLPAASLTAYSTSYPTQGHAWTPARLPPPEN